MLLDEPPNILNLDVSALVWITLSALFNCKSPPPSILNLSALLVANTKGLATTIEDCIVASY